MQFQLRPLRFCFVARDSIHFAQGKSANILRGAFGTIFRRIACVPRCVRASECELRSSCPYARLFEPGAIERGPSGLADWPRPFVFRAMHLDGLTFNAGAEFYFDLNLFDTAADATAYLIRAFAQLAREGLGPGRRKLELVSVPQVASPLELSLAPEKKPVPRVRIRFVTPTELKSGQQIATEPDFGILAARIRDRISTLRQLYGPGPLDIDFRAFGERASRVCMTHCELRRSDVKRRSSRTGQVHPIGGFVGEAEYEGDLAEFLPYLIAAKWTGVGRQTVWGKGEIEVLNPASPEVIHDFRALDG